MNALILVDLQNDFMPGGTLAVRLGDEVVPVANRLAALFPLVVATQDWHPHNHGSFVTSQPGKAIGDLTTLGGVPQVVWPVHCVQDSAGAAFHAALQIGLIDKVFPKGTHPAIDSYSGFFDNDHQHDTGLLAYLQANHVTCVYVMGLATDYCVKATALDAQAAGLKTVLVLDGCRGVELHAGDTDAALAQLRQAGVVVATYKEVTQALSQPHSH